MEAIKALLGVDPDEAGYANACQSAIDDCVVEIERLRAANADLERLVSIDLEVIREEYDAAEMAKPPMATNWAPLSRHVPLLLSEVDRLYRLLDEKGEEVDDKSELGHAMAAAWERRATAALAEVEQLRAANADMERAYALHTGAFRVDL